MRSLFLALALLAGFTVPSFAVELTQEQKELMADKINAGIDSAKAWLSVVDEERYSESWQRGAKHFKAKVPDGQWDTTMRQVRYPLGKVLSREVNDYQFSTRLFGAPPGEYVIIKFRTSFEKQNDADETLTVTIDPDGQWRVYNYQVK